MKKGGRWERKQRDGGGGKDEGKENALHRHASPTALRERHEVFLQPTVCVFRAEPAGGVEGLGGGEDGGVEVDEVLVHADGGLGRVEGGGWG